MGIVGSRAHPEVIAVSKQRNEGGGPSDAVQSTADECSSPVIEEEEVEEEEDWSPNFRVSYLFDNLFVSGSDVPVPTARTRRRDALRPLITLFSLGSNSSSETQAREHMQPVDQLPPPVDLTGKLTKLEGGITRQGGFSDVFEGIVIETGEKVAIKCLRATNISGSDAPEVRQERLQKRLMREMRVLALIRHPRIAHLIGHAKFEERPSLILPWYPNGCLPEYLKKNAKANRTKLIMQIAEGLAHLHSYVPPIAHSDIKPQNVLIDASGKAALTDFGLARLLDGEHTGLTTSKDPSYTIRYCSPETIDGAPQSTMSDVYSFACLTFEILTGTCPYGDLKGVMGLLNAKANNQTPARVHNKLLTDSIWRLLTKCWATNPLERPTMVKVIQKLKGQGWRS